MAEPISLTLAAVAFVEPVIRATYQAYSLLRLSRSFGPDFNIYCRKLDGQKARLEEWSQWPIGALLHSENDGLAKVVVAELAAMQESLARCAAIRSKYEANVKAKVNESREPEIPISNGKKSPPREWSRTLIDVVCREHAECGPQTTAHSSQSSTSFGSQSDESAETTVTSIHNSLLDVQLSHPPNDVIVQNVANRQHKDAENLQNSTGFRKRAAWVAKDREDFKNAIKAITESNDLIERLVRTRALKSLSSAKARKMNGEKEIEQKSRNVPAQAQGCEFHALPAEEKSCIKVLTQLHGALIQSTKGKEGSAMAKSRFGFKASLNHSLTRESLLLDFEELPFRKDSQVSLLQALKPSGPNESTLLLAESLLETSPVHATTAVHLNGLDPFVHLGDFSSTTSDTHRLYRDSTSWASISSLQDLIGSQEKPPGTAVRYRLAALLAVTYLHSTGLSHTPGQLSPENFKYFDILSEAESITLGEILEDEDRLLNVYYFSGIGSVRPRTSTRGIGALQGTTPIFDIATTELGLLLYQVGSWRRLENAKVSSAAALEKIRGTVKQRIHELHREAGLRYAETVEKCLGWRHRPAKEREAELPRLYTEIIKSLKDLDEDLRLGSFNVMSSYVDRSCEKYDEACPSSLGEE